jgi:hypothetical protein
MDLEIIEVKLREVANLLNAAQDEAMEVVYPSELGHMLGKTQFAITDARDRIYKAKLKLAELELVA